MWGVIVMNKKLFVFDIDGTILDSNDQILPSTYKIVEKLQNDGHVVALATGRLLNQTIDIAKKLKIKKHIICLTGVNYYNIETAQLTIEGTVPHAVINEMIELAKSTKRQLYLKTPGKGYRFYFGTNVLTDIKDGDFWLGGASRNPRYLDWEEYKTKIDYNTVCQCSIKAEKIIINEHYRKLKEDLEINKKLAHILTTSKVYLEANPFGISKYSTIKKVQKMENINDEDVYCFGDSGNDMEMLSSVEHGVAMGNALEKVKNIAKYITDSNNDDGVSNFILKYVY